MSRVLSRAQPAARRGLCFSEEAEAPQSRASNLLSHEHPNEATPAPRERLPPTNEEAEEETTPPLAPPHPREAWVAPVAVDSAISEGASQSLVSEAQQAAQRCIPPELLALPLAAVQQHAPTNSPSNGPLASEYASEAPQAPQWHVAPIPPALLALPRPVLAAAMAMGQTERAQPATATARSERAARTARRTWSETSKLLAQRAALASRDLFPAASLAEHELAELLAPVFAEAASLQRARVEEAQTLAAARHKAKQLTQQLGELVTHIGAGGSYVQDLRGALEATDDELARMKKQHASSLAQLEMEEKELEAELEAFARRVEGWDREDALAAQQRPTASVAASTPTPPPPSKATDTAPRKLRQPSSSSATTARTVAPSCGGARGACDAAAEARMHAEVAEVDAHLGKLGGAACGWDDKEHAAYMRLRVQCLGTQAASSPCASAAAQVDKSAAAAGDGEEVVEAGDSRVAHLLERAARELPGRDLDAVREHEQAIERRLAALARRREIVRAWRQRRKDEADAAKARAEAATAAAAAARERRKRDEALSRRADEEARLQELESYRARKLQQHADKDAAAAHEEEAATRRVSAEMARRQRVKEALSERAMQRAAEQSALRSLKERQRREEHASLAHERQLALLAMQQRDAAALQRKQHAQSVRAAAQQRREERYQQMLDASRPAAAKVAARDATRVSRPTQAASARADETARCKEQQRQAQAQAQAASGGASTVSRFGSASCSFANAGSRAKVGWRSGL